MQWNKRTYPYFPRKLKTLKFKILPKKLRTNVNTIYNPTTVSDGQPKIFTQCHVAGSYATLNAINGEERWAQSDGCGEYQDAFICWTLCPDGKCFWKRTKDTWKSFITSESLVRKPSTNQKRSDEVVVSGSCFGCIKCCVVQLLCSWNYNFNAPL